ncbi:MAG: hypothetical protein ACE5I5_04670 [Candidatus Heimdallarchaeota archaeon]
MWFKKLRKDKKEPPTEPKEEEKTPTKEAKEPEEEAKPRKEPTRAEQEPLEKVGSKEMESPTNPEQEVKDFLQSRASPFTIRELTKGTNLSLKTAKTVLQTLITTGEVDTRTFGKTSVYWRTGRFRVEKEAVPLGEGISESTQEEIQRLKEAISRLEQERAAQARDYEALKSQLKEMEAKEIERPEEQLPNLQERITNLEDEKKNLLQQNEKLRTELVGFQTQFTGKGTEWKAVAERMAEEMAARAGTSIEEVLEFFEAPGY